MLDVLLTDLWQCLRGYGLTNHRLHTYKNVFSTLRKAGPTVGLGSKGELALLVWAQENRSYPLPEAVLGGGMPPPPLIPAAGGKAALPLTWAKQECWLWWCVYKVD